MEFINLNSALEWFNFGFNKIKLTDDFQMYSNYFITLSSNSAIIKLENKNSNLNPLNRNYGNKVSR